MYKKQRVAFKKRVAEPAAFIQQQGGKPADSLPIIAKEIKEIGQLYILGQSNLIRMVLSVSAITGFKNSK